jgi:catechol 2,3-dioxygenase-like lactoylglutathione lyase family enzyme
VRVSLSLALALLIWSSAALAQIVKSVESVGMTVSDMDRSVEFFSKVLSFEKVSDVEVHGAEYEKLQSLVGLRMRVVRMKLGDELIELTEYLAPQGRPIPVDWRSNDHAFQHIAIVVSDMDKAYLQLRSHKVRHASTDTRFGIEQTAGIRAFYFKDPDGHNRRLFIFRRQGGSALAEHGRQALSRHRPHRHRGFEHRERA